MVIKQAVNDYLFKGDLAEVDPQMVDLINYETLRQNKALIMIPSESSVPRAVRDVLASTFHNLYAEGYPLESTRTMSEDDLLDYSARLPEFRRHSDERYYKGTEYANVAESLARRRTAEVFAANGYSADQLYVNVQPLSGAPANNAVYTALLNVGDTVMGMDLIEGGHLTHGSPVNRSGRYYNIISYGSNPETGQIDYDRMMELALEHKPRMIIGGFSSFPYQADWQRYREVADAVGAYLLADIAHVAGLIAAGIYPNPIGIADVVTFTTHKTLCGPRGAVIITHRKDLAPKIDRGVFPGEQGGPHVNTIAAIAVAMKLARTEQFRELQKQVVINTARLAQRLMERGLKIAYGGTDTHLFGIDLRSLEGPDGTTLSGDMAARILDLCGIVANRQTIPGDTSALRPSGLRLGTTWITQRGFGTAEIDELADIIADVLQATVPYSLPSMKRPLARARIDFKTLQYARLRVRDLADHTTADDYAADAGYPHQDYLEPATDEINWQTLTVRGSEARAFLHGALTSDVGALGSGQSQATRILDIDGHELACGIVEQIDHTTYNLHIERNAAYIATWLRSLSEGFVMCAPGDPYARLPGPVEVHVIGAATAQNMGEDDGYAAKSFFIGSQGEHYAGPRGEHLPPFEWQEPDDNTLLTTSLHSLHQQLGAKMVPFAGYDMPVWYTSVTQEHMAVRQGAGVFDVTHMGAFDARGPGAAAFLDAVTTNDVVGLQIGRSHYTYFLNTDGIPVDDLMIYRLAEEHYLLVVNASNNDKNWAWLNAVKAQQVMIDPDNPSRRIEGADRVELRDLRNPSAGAEMRVDIALQGPSSMDILLSLANSADDKQHISSLPWAGITRASVGGFDLIVSRTGYTGERIAYELFVHPDQALALFQALVEGGATPCGLAARDSLRTEAGLPLYGHELAGPLNLGPADAGFGVYVKLWKPFFIGRTAHIARELQRSAEIVRFRLDSKAARPPHQGDPLVDRKGRVVGIVTSCSIDSEGYQLGQAYVKLDYSTEGTPLAVFSGTNRAKSITLEGLNMGSKVTVAEPVTVLSRFPKRGKK